MINLLCLGEVVNAAGLYAIKNGLKKIINDNKIDLVICNGEGLTGGYGLGKKHALYLKKLGVDIITIGEKGFFKKDLGEQLQKCSYILRPINFPTTTIGRGYKILELDNKKICVATFLGQSCFNKMHLNNPFIAASNFVEKFKDQIDIFIIDFHATTTAEKKSFAYMLDGKVAVVTSTHTKALTADCAILEKGTGVISDTGIVGSTDSVGGFEAETEIEKFITAAPMRSKSCFKRIEIQGAIFTIDGNKCVATKLVKEPIEYIQTNEDSAEEELI